jgi:BirA family transcriptional regulator, biotin operon repressor / biotin---[acetyl-CoA-carboxylase] ligase
MISQTHMALLAALAGRTTPRSGDELAQALGLTRARVSQLVKTLNEQGADITVSRAGYEIAGHASMLNAESAAQGTPFTVRVDAISESTNATLIANGAPHAHVHLAEWQSAGRGRRGRTWAGAPCGSVLMSVAWQFDRGASGLSGLSLSVGVAIVKALHSCGVSHVQLKWPNDVLWNGQKLGGVLIELVGDALGPTTAVIGIGLNVRLPDAAREDIAQAVTDLHTVVPSQRWDRNALVNALLRALDQTLREFSQHGFAPHAPAWRAAHAYERRAVQLLLPTGERIEGKETTVADDGALCIQCAGKTQMIHSAEISLRVLA